MKKKILLIFAVLSLNFNLKAVDCVTEHFFAPMTVDLTDVVNIEQMINDYAESIDCDRDWSKRIGFIFTPISNCTVLGPTVHYASTGTLNLVNIASALDNLAAYTNTDYCTFRIDVKIEKKFWMSVDYIVYSIPITLIHGNSLQLTDDVLCSDKPYTYSTFWNNYLSYNSLTFTVGGSSPIFSGSFFDLPQPVSSSTTVVANFIVLGQNITRSFIRQVQPMIPATWNTSSDYQVSISDPDINLNSYTISAASSIEYLGNGVVGNMFDPSYGVGDRLVKLRSDNLGCKSYWKDTIIEVFDIVSVVSAPVMNNLFPFGEVSYLRSGNCLNVVDPVDEIYTNSLGGAIPYHQGCAGEQVTFKIQSPVVGLTYHWEALFDNDIISLGTGTTKTVTLPNNDEIYYDYYGNNNFDLFNTDVYTLYNIGGYLCEDILFSNTTGSTSPPDVNSIGTQFIGDKYTVRVKAVNVSGASSPYSTPFVVGIMPMPIIAGDLSVCVPSSGTVNLESNTTHSAYITEFPLQYYRTTEWNIDSDVAWELVGSSVPYNLTGSSKYYNFGVHSMDSSAYRMIKDGDTSYFYVSSADRKCKSNIDTVRVVRNPDATVNWNTSGSVFPGALVRGYREGDYISSSDSVRWVYTDDSNEFYGDTSWHYLNDLGIHGYTVYSIDTFGCSSITENDDEWYLFGYLVLDENQDIDFNQIVLRNPFIQDIEFVNWIGDHIQITDNTGKILYDGKADAIINFTQHPSGNYYLYNLDNRGKFNIVKI